MSIRYRRLMPGLALVLAMTGCATLDRESCLSADWQLIGFSDGVAGREASRLEQHRDACSEYGVVPRMDQYLQGYDRGVRRYCTAANGYRQARAGKAPGTVCHAEQQAEFVRGFELGTKAHQQVARLESARHELSILISEQRADLRERDDKREQLIMEGISSDTRAFLLSEIDELEHEIRLRHLQIKQQQQAVRMETRYLQDLEADLRKQL
ncbi:DUF2799 domain-containing protein [Amphritea pacifica]|uniref:DUF2799 domain-containing protein n=1 Tax=Amphritea pacifica TaxID=2811233 RepID=A0ABS2WAR1_9GAMM|nr:DUF2799 domain-containing protein [Amphritea pacifica]MBN0988432.1 DUF2799 domain-containing protein [Amphritea pacifica]